VSHVRRNVRAAPDFFTDLDHQLPPERTDARLSRTDFQAYELLRIVDEFALRFDMMAPMIPGRPDYRALVISGQVVPRISVIGQLAPDGAVELVQLDLDLDGTVGVAVPAARRLSVNAGGRVWRRPRCPRAWGPDPGVGGRVMRRVSPG
jgi:hypothetical protein